MDKLTQFRTDLAILMAKYDIEHLVVIHTFGDQVRNSYLSKPEEPHRIFADISAIAAQYLETRLPNPN